MIRSTSHRVASGLTGMPGSHQKVILNPATTALSEGFKVPQPVNSQRYSEKNMERAVPILGHDPPSDYRELIG